MTKRDNIYIVVQLCLFVGAGWYGNAVARNMVRSTLLRQGHLATQRVIQGGCRNYVPETQLFEIVNHEMIEFRTLDGTIFHALLC